MGPMAAAAVCEACKAQFKDCHIQKIRSKRSIIPGLVAQPQRQKQLLLAPSSLAALALAAYFAKKVRGLVPKRPIHPVFEHLLHS